MVGEWRESTWGAEISLEYGKGLRGYTDSHGPVRVFGTNGPVGWTDEPLAPGPGIIVGRKGAYRGVHYSHEPFFVIDTAYYVVPRQRLHMRWLYYAIQHYKITEINDGSPIPSTTRAAVYVRKLKIPPLAEQETIADILGSLDDKIELNRRTNRVLEEMARAIFKAWFVDFEPVKAKADGATGFPGMPQEVFDQLPDRFTESELGPVPEGWEVMCLGEMLNFTMGQSPPSKHYNEDGTGLPFHQGVRYYGSRFPEHRVFCTLESRIADANDVLLSVRAPVGRINVADRRMVIGRGLAAARHPEGCCSYTLYTLKHMFAEEDSVGDGTIYKAVTKKFLLQMPVVDAPITVVREAESLLAPIDHMIAMNERESRILAELRDTLLPKLISGELRVSEAERRVEEAV